MAQTQTSPSVFTKLFRWLWLKNYQYEATMSLYMLTFIEKIIFNTLLLFLISLFLTAAYVYLPDHIIIVYKHFWYYWAGDPLSESFKQSLRATNFSSAATRSATEAISMATTATAGKIGEL